MYDHTLYESIDGFQILAALLIFIICIYLSLQTHEHKGFVIYVPALIRKMGKPYKGIIGSFIIALCKVCLCRALISHICKSKGAEGHCGKEGGEEYGHGRHLLFGQLLFRHRILDRFFLLWLLRLLFLRLLLFFRLFFFLLFFLLFLFAACLDILS